MKRFEAPEEDVLKMHVVERVHGELTLDKKLHETRERIGRAHMAQHARTKVNWTGFWYLFAAFLSVVPSIRDNALEYCTRLFPRLLAYEEMVHSKVSELFESFDKAYVWRHNVLWREILAFIFKHGLVEALMCLLQLIFESPPYHTRGLEDIFRCPVQPYVTWDET